jgi:hypothetical protein
MAKTTFLGYVPSLKSKHEATIVGHKAIKSKGGSIRYTLQGEYDGRKTLPKTVSKADFESVYGFDAKEAESVIIHGTKEGKKAKPIAHKISVEEKDGFVPNRINIPSQLNPPYTVETSSLKTGDFENHAETVVGNPSPASVEPSAPSEKPFPQEPSNETFSADEGFFQIDVKHKMEDGWEHYGDYDNEEDATSAYYDIYLNHPEVVLLEVDADGDGDVIYRQRNYDLDVKEAFGFGKKEEKEEEPKTQEFTVVLQEGDKLELTDVEEEDESPDDENTEKEAETLEITDIDWETDDEDVDLPASVLVPSSIVEDEIADYLSDEYGFLVRGYVLNAESNQDIKWSDVKEMGNSKCPFCFRSAFRLLDEEGEEFSVYEENLAGDNWLLECSRCKAEWNQDGENTLHGGYTGNAEYEAVQAKVTRPVKEEPEEESDEGLSTGAKVALGVGALAAGVALFGAEDDYIPYESETDYTEIYEATSGDGYINHDRIDTEEQRMVELRHDSPTTYYNWNSPYDVDESDVDDAVKDELGDEPNEGNYDATVEVLGSKYGENGQKYVDVDVDMETDYGDSRFMGLAAEHESESDGYAYAYTKGHNDGINDEVIYRPSIDTDRGRNIYKKILRQKAETFEAEPRYSMETVKIWQNLPLNELNKIANKLGTSDKIIIMNYIEDNISNYSADTVGSPSPNGPSSTPEPAEATGSEPSNEKMEAEGSNMKMALGILGVGVGAVALLGGDRIKKIFEKLGL